MADFSPEARNSAMWSGDARKIASGRAAEVYLTKIGELPIEDLSDKENVQMGLVMQPFIAREIERRHDIRLRELDIEGTHAKHPWMRSHFDYVGPENVLFEIKNYHAGARSKFGDNGSQDVPAADWAQCVHEAAVYGVNKVTLSVLFGGQELCLFPLTITEEMKEALILQEAALWANVQTRTPPESHHPDDLRALYPQSQERTVRADGRLEAYCVTLKQVKAQIKELEEKETALQGAIQAAMLDAAELIDVEGKRLATWKTAAGSMRFDAKAFESVMPDIYKQFLREMPGSRRFLVK